MRVLGRCGSAAGDEEESSFDKTFDLQQTEPGKNVNLRITNITSKIVRDVSDVGRDLLDTATYVYVLDGSVRRGGDTDVYGRGWVREFTLRVPVRDVAVWNARRSQLERLLTYLTDDEYTFEFVPHTGDPEQPFLEFESHEPFPGADCVCLFSGGADSLAGAVKLARDGRNPLLVSHRSVGVLDRRQKDLRTEVSRLLGSWSFPHLSLWAHRQDLRPYEHTQRSRSFLYLSLAAAVANELDIEEIHIPENGVVSLNLPKLEQAVGARASRSTHPKFIAEFEELASSLLGRPLRVRNPFLLQTKAEVLEEIKRAGHPEVLGLSVSCARTRRGTRAIPHCGECSQCVDRRFSAVAAELERYDPKERYDCDIFTEELTDEGRKQVEAYVRAARRFEAMSIDDFFSEHRSVSDAADCMGGTVSQAIEALYDLHQRYAKQTLQVIEKQIVAHAPAVARGAHPRRGLLALVADERLHRVPAAVLGDKIAKLLAETLPIQFQSEPPDSEKQLQDGIEAALKSGGERLRREGPAVSYSLVETIPDFSSEEARSDLYVEAKLIKNRQSLRDTIHSMARASSYYVDEGARALFIVYDTDRHIKDDAEFAEEFEKKGGVQVTVIR